MEKVREISKFVAASACVNSVIAGKTIVFTWHTHVNLGVFKVTIGTGLATCVLIEIEEVINTARDAIVLNTIAF
jgi:hypothetical protein